MWEPNFRCIRLPVRVVEFEQSRPSKKKHLTNRSVIYTVISDGRQGNSRLIFWNSLTSIPHPAALPPPANQDRMGGLCRIKYGVNLISSPPCDVSLTPN